MSHMFGEQETASSSLPFQAVPRCWWHTLAIASGYCPCTRRCGLRNYKGLQPCQNSSHPKLQGLQPCQNSSHREHNSLLGTCTCLAYDCGQLLNELLQLPHIYIYMYVYTPQLLGYCDSDFTFVWLGAEVSGVRLPCHDGRDLIWYRIKIILGYC